MHYHVRQYSAFFYSLHKYRRASTDTRSLKCQDPATVHVWSRLEPGRAEPTQDYRDFQRQLYGRGIAKVGVQRSCGKDPRGEQNRRRRYTRGVTGYL